MKNNLLKALILLTFMNCYCQDLDVIELDIKQINLKGNVSKITETRYSNLEYYNNTKTENKPTKHIFNFNTKGNIVEVINYYQNQTLFLRQKCIYDKNQNVVELKQDFPEKTMSTVVSYKYDKKNNLIEKDIYNKKIYFKYNLNNNLIKEESYYDDGSLNYKHIYIYDNLGLKILGYYYSYDNKLLLKAEHKYDKIGKEIEIKWYFPDGKSLQSTRYIRYDTYGNIIEHNPFYSDYTTAKYKYSYDKKRNWIKRIELRNDKEEEIIERKIEYNN